MVAKKSPSVVGFKPSSEDNKMIAELIQFLDKSISIPGVKVTASDVLRMAIKELYTAKISNPKNRYM